MGEAGCSWDEARLRDMNASRFSKSVDVQFLQTIDLGRNMYLDATYPLGH